MSRKPAKLRASAGIVHVLLLSFCLGLFLAGATGMGFLISQRENADRLQAHLVQQERSVQQLEMRSRGLKQSYRNLQTDELAWRQRLVQLKDQIARAELTYTQIREKLFENQTYADQVEATQQRVAEEIESMREQKRVHLTKAEQIIEENKELERKMIGLRNKVSLAGRDYKMLSKEVKGATPQSLGGYGGVPLTQDGPFANTDSSEAIAMAYADGSYELKPVVVGDGRPYRPPIESAVMKVNLAHQFIVLDKGSTDGVQEGMVFDIKRGTEWLGRIKTVMVEQGVAACDILSSKEDAVFRIGDVAVLGDS